MNPFLIEHHFLENVLHLDSLKLCYLLEEAITGEFDSWTGLCCSWSSPVFNLEKIPDGLEVNDCDGINKIAKAGETGV